MKDAKQILLDTIEVLDKHGWCQHEDSAEDGSFCLLQALRFATSPTHPDKPFMFLSDNNYYDAYSALWAAILFRNPDRLIQITDWNDASGRTKKEIIEVLREAIELLTPFNVG